MSQHRRDKGSPIRIASPRVSSLTASVPVTNDRPRSLTLAEARRKALEDIKSAERARLQYAEAEALRWYDYKDNE